MKKILTFFIFWFLTTFIYFRLPVASLAQATLSFLSKSQSPFALFFPTFILAGLSAYFFNVFLWALVEQKIAKHNVIIFYILYFILAFSTLLLRGNSGFYGWNFNPLNIFTSGQFFSLVTLLNLLLFVPVGFLLKLNLKHLVIMGLVIAFVEVAQFLTQQGYCDIDDWILNMISFIIGSQVSALTKKIMQRKTTND